MNLTINTHPNGEFNHEYNNKNLLNIKSELEKQHVKQELINAQPPFNPNVTLQTQKKCVYNAVWKENYFPMTVDLYEPRGLKYMCAECCESFVTKLSILTHSMIHRKFFCIICLLYCDNQQEMNKHLTTFHAHLIKLKEAETQKNDEENLSPTVTSSESICHEDDKSPLKLNVGRKPGTKNRFPPLRKKNKIEAIENLPDTPGRTLKSRFGRCITVKTPSY